MRMRHFRFIGGLVAGTLLVGGISWAAIPTSTTGVYYGCANKNTGALRVIDYQAGKRCTAAERTITWNQKGATGAKGAPGATGANGANGAAGAAGSAGPTGAPGADGATVLSGSGAPTNSVGVNGDFYIDLISGRLYGPKASATWGGFFSLIGPTGATGSTGATGATGAAGTNGASLLNGARTPIAGDGANGDFWLNTATSTIYGPKAAGAWSDRKSTRLNSSH